MRLKVIFDEARPNGLSVVNAETGEPVEGLAHVEITQSFHCYPEARITISNPQIDVIKAPERIENPEPDDEA